MLELSIRWRRILISRLTIHPYRYRASQNAAHTISHSLSSPLNRLFNNHITQSVPHL
ncbi:hypothetical protein Hanom_Chr05g00389791 [Helianthus anomalus]